MTKYYYYTESDDKSANFIINNLNEFLEDFNQFFNTDYKSVNEFNKGEQKANGIREIKNLEKALLHSYQDYESLIESEIILFDDWDERRNNNN